MADPMKPQLQELRAAVARAKQDLELAVRRRADAEHVHRRHAGGTCLESCSRGLREAEEAFHDAEARLSDAHLERHASARRVREWIRKPDQDNCFVVNARTGEPTGDAPTSLTRGSYASS